MSRNGSICSVRKEGDSEAQVLLADQKTVTKPKAVKFSWQPFCQSKALKRSSKQTSVKRDPKTLSKCSSIEGFPNEAIAVRRLEVEGGRKAGRQRHRSKTSRSLDAHRRKTGEFNSMSQTEVTKQSSGHDLPQTRSKKRLQDSGFKASFEGNPATVPRQVRLAIERKAVRKLDDLLRQRPASRNTASHIGFQQCQLSEGPPSPN